MQCNECNVMNECNECNAVLSIARAAGRNLAIFVTFTCPGIPGYESNKNAFIICNVVLDQLTLSQ